MYWIVFSTQIMKNNDATLLQQPTHCTNQPCCIYKDESLIKA